MSDEHNLKKGRRGGRVGDKALIKPRKESFLSYLWASFLAGIVVAAPIGITAAIIWWFLTGPMADLDAFVKRTLPAGGSNFEALLQVLPGVGVAIAFVALVILGAVARNFIGRSFIHAGEHLVDRVPVVRNLYRFFKNVFETALAQSERSFKEVALIQYPRPGAWAIAFVIGPAKGEVKAKLVDQLNDQDEALTALFVPTVPNPTSGFLLFIPRRDLRILSMTVEEAAKVVLSLGLVVPEFSDPDDAVKTLEALAETAREQKPKKRLFTLGKS